MRVPLSVLLLPLPTAQTFMVGAWGFGEEELQVAKHYGLPIASYRDAAWPVSADPPSDLRIFWDGTKHVCHPQAETHELVSDVVKWALLQLLLQPQSDIGGKASLSSSCPFAPDAIVPFTSLDFVTAACMLWPSGPLTMLRSTPGVTPLPQPTRFSGNWTYFADRRNKFGWIG